LLVLAKTRSGQGFHGVGGFTAQTRGGVAHHSSASFSPSGSRSVFATLLIVQPPEGAFNQTAQLISSAVNGLIQGLGMMSDCDRLAALETGFEHATHVVNAVLLVAVLIAQVDLHSSDMLAGSAQGIFYDTTKVSGLCFVTFNVTVGINLDLQGVLLF
jgi:hypothetical protein